MPRSRETPIALTNKSLLAIMKPGRTYPTYALARKFRLTAQELRPTLDALVKRGKLEQCRASAKTVGFRLPAQDDVTTGMPITAASASAPATGIFAGVLKGYDSEFAQRTSLCMLVRRA